ncbi:hybrid sensor histidine kinase/response regulator [Paraburkholderia sp. 31.1]|uniref:hybrid sensor histidine kinase/response regulator n=1 Tax=Paraburkholderia sp. 31.1 TaxID=2615205 RepID=UPI0016556C3A|nr:hybrid sensor histidine kinase/response regulator [Paraburkholderia sp. 31.1]MBC8724792.1 hybrid sensor histidine kinase/response regulator [Paraburkholderia sp. 31.1]
MAFDIAFAAIRRIAPLATIGGDLSSQWCGDKAHRCGALSHGDFSGPAGLMKLSGFVVRKFASADLERAFRTDYARRYAGQRRLAGAASLLLWILFARRDWWLLTRVDPSIIFHVGYLRLAGAVGMAVPICLMWGPRAFDERWVVGLLCVWMLSCWFTLLQLMELYPAALAFREVFPEFLLVLFTIFTLLRLRAITAAWLVGLGVVSFHLTLSLWPRTGASTVGAGWASRGSVLAIMYFMGVVICIQFERAARREFMFRRTLRAASARVQAASSAVKRQNERMRELVREKERFFSSAYHDIQQPLAAINLFIRSARTKLEAGHAATHDLDVIEETAGDILDMFKNIQDYSELGSYVPSLSPIDTQAVLADVFEQYLEPARSQGIEIRSTMRLRRPPPIESDRSLFKRVLSNLVSNAIKNTRTGGVVIGWVEVGERLRIDVWDTGVGISPAHRDAIFAEYYQIDNPGRDRSKGLGLGLSIVQRVIGILPGHSLRFYSVEGRGSHFSLYAPISIMTPVIGTEDRKDDAYTSVLKGKYVLLCDDEPTVLEGLRRLFISAGALVDTAGSMTGFEAILADEGRAPDVLVTDIRLREGPNGIELAERIRRRFDWAGALPVAFITGELISPPSLRDFSQPFVLLRKSSAPENTLVEVSRFVAAQQPADFCHVRDP